MKSGIKKKGVHHLEFKISDTGKNTGLKERAYETIS